MGRRLVRWKAVVILLVVLGIIFYVVMAQSRQRLDALSTRNEQLQQQYAALDQKNRDLREELTYVATDAYIEETARNEFGYVRDGEIHFHLPAWMCCEATPRRNGTRCWMNFGIKGDFASASPFFVTHIVNQKDRRGEP